ncbi:hypothetical protein HYFRA_00013155 [Hymenoscyphus fraxineus]|uniref:Uncharacterized protein n=1 Tax=Hymenoscyphus fraxineus TaxID=746836 RepID=A0A9N9L883_9HELO|nr:hypothetical protein HYFRA_00013155 [Hymenoscyphus fraxineus]
MKKRAVKIGRGLNRQLFRNPQTAGTKMRRVEAASTAESALPEMSPRAIRNWAESAYKILEGSTRPIK